MRRALGLYGDTPRSRPEPERIDPPSRPIDRYAPGGHRRRFVQDGDVPVTIVRRDGSNDPLVSRPAAPVSPTSSRLQRTEAALAAETAARDRAERALGEAQATIRDLQTKIGHAELTKSEAIEALRKEREAIATQRVVWEERARRLTELEARLTAVEDEMARVQDELTEERAAHKATERSLREALEARDAAERLAQELSEPSHVIAVEAEPVPHRAPVRLTVGTPARGRRKRLAAEPEVEPEPVKWWLMPAAGSKRR